MFISTYAGGRTPADAEHSQKMIEARTATVDRLTLEWVEVPRADEFAKGHLVCQVQQGIGVWAPQQVVYVLEVRRKKWLGLLTESDLEPSSSLALSEDTGVEVRVNKWIYEPSQIGAVLDHWRLRS
jgi:hypothetical protein